MTHACSTQASSHAEFLDAMMACSDRWLVRLMAPWGSLNGSMDEFFLTDSGSPKPSPNPVSETVCATFMKGRLGRFQGIIWTLITLTMTRNSEFWKLLSAKSILGTKMFRPSRRQVGSHVRMKIRRVPPDKLGFGKMSGLAVTLQIHV